MSDKVCEHVRRIFRADKAGEVTLEVRTIDDNSLMKSDKISCTFSYFEFGTVDNMPLVTKALVIIETENTRICFSDERI